MSAEGQGQDRERLAAPRGLNHLPDEVLQQAIAEMP